MDKYFFDRLLFWVRLPRLTLENVDRRIENAHRRGHGR